MFAEARQIRSLFLIGPYLPSQERRLAGTRSEGCQRFRAGQETQENKAPCEAQGRCVAYWTFPSESMFFFGSETFGSFRSLSWVFL
jgi:hypothetical protein